MIAETSETCCSHWEGLMKAIVFRQHGTLENIEFTEIDDSVIAEDQCLIKVHAVSLNGFDPMVLRGIPGLKTPLPMIPGADFAGEIVAIGAAVDSDQWKAGDRVSAMPDHDDGMMGETKRGACCELVAIDQQYLLALPENVSYEQAACLPTAYGAAIRMMQTRGKVCAGEKVLILGASGGVGTCCVQLAKAAGAEVIACTSSADKATKLAALGADMVINTSTHDYVKEVIAKYGKPSTRGHGGGVDVIVNYTGGDTWAQCFRVLTLQGRLLTCGATAGYEPKTDLRYIWSFEMNIIGSNGWTRENVEDLLQMVAAGQLQPSIQSVNPLSDYVTCLQSLVNREVFGKIILQPVAR
jgi:alcohol dehydrogenase